MKRLMTEYGPEIFERKGREPEDLTVREGNWIPKNGIEEEKYRRQNLREQSKQAQKEHSHNHETDLDGIG
eukprot:5913731-Ditylum_brightwellii.AAC.1